MANKNITIKDNEGNSCFPKTFDFNVFNSSNQSLNNLLANIDATKMKVFPYAPYDCNTCYDAGIYEVANGINYPSGSPYGVLLTLPYRMAFGNLKPDFAAQIYIPNGDDVSKPNSMYYRTSLGESWSTWRECVSLIESYRSSDGKSWYRKYSDGFKECGGTTTITSLATVITISMPLSFSDTNYTLALGDTGAKDTNTYNTGFSAKTVDSFTHVGGTTANSVQNAFDWYACGY